jgi:arylsulfatase A-like enzyme
MRRGGLAGLVPSPEGARLEFVNLKARRRSLLLGVAGVSGDSEVTLTREGDELARSAVSRRVRLGLPNKLPLGRVAVDLHFSEVGSLAVEEARLQPVLPAGAVVFQESAIVQAPWSAIDFVQDVGAGATLLGGFNPPRTAGDEQAFQILIETAEAGMAPVFQWPDEGGQSGPRDLRIQLPESAGVVRVRLRAVGQGEPGRWERLRVVEAPPQPVALDAPRRPRIVILYVFDALRADYVGHLGGSEGVSPTLDRLAAEGVTFTDHISIAPNTKPSVKSLFIGRPFLLRGHEMLPEDGPETLAESFLEAGYRTVALSGSPWVSKSFGTNRGFEYRSPKAEYRGRHRSGADYSDSAERVHGATLEWLEQLGDDERAFLYVHTMHPHNPYDPPEPYLGRYTDGIDSEIDGGTGTLLAIQHGRRETSEADRERLRGLYSGGLAYNDAELEGFLGALEERFEPGEVLLVLTSDHGEELFEHDGVLHGYTLYEEQLRIPLIVWWPGVLDPRRVDVGTDHLDLAATLQTLVGQEPALEHGTPLWDLMEGRTESWAKPVRFAAASSVAGGIFMARSQDLKLIWAPRQGRRWGMGQGVGRTSDSEYLFDLANDPEELVNRAATGGLEGEWLRGRLRAWIERGRLEEVGGGDEQVDPETLERLRALGYVD